MKLTADCGLPPYEYVSVYPVVFGVSPVMVILPVLVAHAVGLTDVPDITGIALTLTVVVLIQPLLLVYVMVVDPVDTPVTTPVLLMVATPVLEDNQGLEAAGVADPVRLMVEPTQTTEGPVMVGKALTVTGTEAEQLLLLVNVMVAVPALFPVTTPVELTVATDVLELTHGLDAAGVPVAERLIVDPTQTLPGPLITGVELTGRLVVSVVAPHSLVTERLILNVPAVG